MPIRSLEEQPDGVDDGEDCERKRRALPEANASSNIFR